MVFAHGLSALHSRFDNLDCDTKKKVLKVSASVVGLIAIHKVCTYAYSYIADRRIRERKLNQTQTTKGKLLQKLVGLKQPMDNRDVLTKLSYEEIRDRLRRNDLKVIDLLEAFQAKALEIDRSLNCITDIIYDADVTALYLDSLPPENRGRLHGIPLSLKENYAYADYDSYFGCVSRCFKPEKCTATIVEALINEGMVPFARTTMSQGGMSIACDNPLFGETVHPHDNTRTCGGSSGGEGALIGGGGSIVGLGNDVGGSIRIPASYCGLYGLKPTRDRLGSRNMPEWKHDLLTLSYGVTNGPISSDFDLLVDVTNVLFSPALYDLDDSIPRLPFDSQTYDSETPMTIGFYKSFPDDSCFEVVPSIKRGIELAKAALERRGHKVVEWEPPNMRYAIQLLIRCLTVDGGEQFDQFSKEEFSKNSAMRQHCLLSHFPRKVKIILGYLLWLASPVVSRHTLAAVGEKSPRDVLMLNEKARIYKEEFSKAWSDAGLDGVICPVLPCVAPLLGDTDYIASMLLYSNLYNFLDYPAGVVPVSEVKDDDITQLHASYPRDNVINRLILKTQAGSVGLPVSIQCVAKRWQDEKALRLMKEVKLGLSTDD